MQFLKLIFLLFFCCNNINAQDIPRVINASNNSDLLDQLSATYKSSLFNASDTSVAKTIQNWKHLLAAMEIYSEQINFDLKGVKLWIKVFWAKDGSIDHISYLLSDKSINIALVDLEAFLSSFIKNYTLPEEHKQLFSHDARIRFPLYLMR